MTQVLRGSPADPDDDGQILDMIDRWVARELKPIVKEYDHADRYPHEVVEQMKELGLFGATIAPEYGGLGLPATTYARIVMSIASVWMSITGIINSHLMLALAIQKFGTPQQKARWLPKLATGEIRGGLALTEPDAGTDLQGIRMTARRDGDHYVINGTKTWITNGAEGSCLALLVKTNPDAQPRHNGMSLFIAPKQEGFSVGRKLHKLGYKAIDTAEIDLRKLSPAGRSSDRRRRGPRLLPGRPAGWNSAASMSLRAASASRRARLKLAVGIRADPQDLRQADLRASGDPAEARRDGDARPRRAAAHARCRAGLRPRRTLRHGSRHGQVFRQRGRAGELRPRACASTAPTATPKEFDIERLYRDAPLTCIGEGTNEMQRIIISKQLIKRNPAA